MNSEWDKLSVKEKFFVGEIIIALRKAGEEGSGPFIKHHVLMPLAINIARNVILKHC